MEGDLHEEAPGLRALDGLWEPRASAIELQALYRALDGAVSPLVEKPPAPARRQSSSHPKARELAAATRKDLALAQAELARLRGRTWRLSRLLARVSAVLKRRQTPKGDPIAAVSNRMRKAARRLERIEASPLEELAHGGSADRKRLPTPGDGQQRATLPLQGLEHEAVLGMPPGKEAETRSSS